MKQADKTKSFRAAVLCGLFGCFCILICGCSQGGYSNQSLYPDNVTSVYVEMFDNQSFERGVEYELTDALAKRIEAQTPFKIISDRNRADSVLGGYIVSAGRGVLTGERQTGRALENDVIVTAVVTWKNLKTGELMIDNESVAAAASYSQWQNQGFRYGATLAANKAAEKIVELMEKNW